LRELTSKDVKRLGLGHLLESSKRPDSEPEPEGEPFKFHGIHGRIVMIKLMPDETINMDCFQERLIAEGKIPQGQV
jgi:hypothetical protein